jgi:ribosomal protein S6--L-glutamate ligase
MIVSFHPIIEGDENIICAGRLPDETDLAAIKRADAVILPQGCSESLYWMARRNCPHVFPNLDVRFDFPGKRGQIQLFERLGLEHPETRCYDSVANYRCSSQQIAFPAVVKFYWGGQGDTVFKVTHQDDLAKVIERASDFESTAQNGFLIQQFIAARGRSLRVVVIGSRFISYWRVQSEKDAFGTSVADGASIDHSSDRHLQKAAKDRAKHLCRETGLQLAGFDFIFDEADVDTTQVAPLILEINFYFGRTGLGGSDAYYQLLKAEVDKWLRHLSR